MANLIVANQVAGANARVVFTEDSTWGTTNATTPYLLNGGTYGASLTKNVNTLISNAITSARARASIRGGNSDVSGTVPFEFNTNGMGRFIKHAIGSAATTAPAAKTITVSSTDVAGVVTVTTSAAHGFEVNDYVTISASNSTAVIDGVHQVTTVPTTTTFTILVTAGTITVAGSAGSVVNNNYVHKITNGALPAAGMSIELGYLDALTPEYHVYDGCKIGSLGMTIGNDGFVTGSAEMVGRELTINTAQLGAPTSVAHNPYTHLDAVVSDGGTALTLQSVDFTYNNNMTPDRAVGSQAISSLKEGVADCSLTLAFFYQDKTYIDKVIAETASTNKIVLDSGSEVVEFEMTNGKYTGSVGVPIAQEQGLFNTLTFTAQLDSGLGTDLTVTLRNAQTTI